MQCKFPLNMSGNLKISFFRPLHFASFVSVRLVTNLNPPPNYVTVSCLFHRLSYINAHSQVVPVRNTWVHANCSAQDDLRPVKMYLMNYANKYFRSACANCQSDEGRHFFQKQSPDPGKVEGRDFEQSARMCRSVRVFAVVTFQETLIKCLFSTKIKRTCMIKMPY